jgi:hypothetical protein
MLLNLHCRPALSAFTTSSVLSALPAFSALMLLNLHCRPALSAFTTSSLLSALPAFSALVLLNHNCRSMTSIEKVLIRQFASLNESP